MRKKIEVDLACMEEPNDFPAFVETLFDRLAAGTGARISNLTV